MEYWEQDYLISGREVKYVTQRRILEDSNLNNEVLPSDSQTGDAISRKWSYTKRHIH